MATLVLGPPLCGLHVRTSALTAQQVTRGLCSGHRQSCPATYTERPEAPRMLVPTRHRRPPRGPSNRRNAVLRDFTALSRFSNRLTWRDLRAHPPGSPLELPCRSRTRETAALRQPATPQSRRRVLALCFRGCPSHRSSEGLSPLVGSGRVSCTRRPSNTLLRRSTFWVDTPNLLEFIFN